MANNLHISYDLYSPGQDYEKVIEKIKSLGDWAKIHKSYWYVRSNYTAKQACDFLWAVMDSSDTVYVVNASDNSAAWQNVSKEVSDFILDSWNK